MQEKQTIYNDVYFIGSTIKVKHIDSVVTVDYKILSINPDVNSMRLKDTRGYIQYICNDVINNYKVQIL